MEGKFRLLIIEDEEKMASGLKDFFEFSNFSVEISHNCKFAIKLFKKYLFDAVILDLMLPDCDGLELCKKIKEDSPKTPVIILTAKGREIDVIRGFESGGDDYVKKPFSLNELLARVKAAIKRSELLLPTPSEFKFSNFIFDSKRCVLKKGKKTYTLTYLESELLKYFLLNQNKVITREELLKEIWKIIPEPENRYIDNYISKLRKKIEDDIKKPKHILTIYGQGYKFVP